MDWSNPAAVVMSHGTAAVLRAVAGSSEPFSIREIARVANISPTHAHQTVTRLADHGLLIIDQKPGFHLVRLNRDHLAAEPSIAIATLRAHLLDRLRDAFAAWPMQALQVSMFGSAARGDGSTRSDIDILVVHPPLRSEGEQDAWDDQLADSGQIIQGWTGNWVGWFQVTAGDLKRMAAAGDPLVHEWQRDAITLSGPPLQALLRSGT